MAENLVDLLKANALILLFTLCIMSFIFLLPIQQGFTFSSEQDNNTYLFMNYTASSIGGNATTKLTNYDNATSQGYTDWDITVGFMGSNAMKESTSFGIRDYFKYASSQVKNIAVNTFGSNSPIVQAISFFIALNFIILTIVVIKFLRSGQ